MTQKITVEYDGPDELAPVVVAARNPGLRGGDRVTIRLDRATAPYVWFLVVHIAATGQQVVLTSEHYALAAIDVQLVRLLAEFALLSLPLPLPPPQYREMKCARCGWVHVAIPRAVAEESGGDIERYLHCFRCGRPTSQFVPAEPGDAPLGCTIQACVMP